MKQWQEDFLELLQLKVKEWNEPENSAELEKMFNLAVEIQLPELKEIYKNAKDTCEEETKTTGVSPQLAQPSETPDLKPLVIILLIALIGCVGVIIYLLKDREGV